MTEFNGHGETLAPWPFFEYNRAMNDIAFLTVKNGGFAIVDAHMCQELNKHPWYRNESGYITRYANSPSQPRKHLTLHHTILPLRKGMCVDHKNGFRFDCTERNLRYATKAQNSYNRPKQKMVAKNPSSKFKGVSLMPKLWRCRLYLDGKEHVSYHRTERAAAEKYNELSKKFHGEFGVPNKVD